MSGKYRLSQFNENKEGMKKCRKQTIRMAGVFRRWLYRELFMFFSEYEDQVCIGEFTKPLLKINFLFNFH